MTASQNPPDESSQSAYDDDRVFTDHVKLLLSGNDDRNNAMAVLEKLTRIAKLGVRRNNISSPAYLGISGQEKWDDETYEELVFRGYERAFVDKRRILSQYVSAGESIDALIATIVEQLVIDLQKKTNPDRYRIFKKVEAAIQSHIDAGRLDCSDSVRIDNALMLGITENTNNLTADKLREAVEKCDVCGKRRLYRCSTTEVSTAILEILKKGRFLLGELVDVIRENAPAGKNIIAASDEEITVYGELGEEVIVSDRTIWPNQSYEEKEAKDVHLQNMMSAINEAGRTAKVKKRLRNLLSLLAESPDLRVADLMDMLKVSKTTFYDDMAQLRRLSEQCSRNS